MLMEMFMMVNGKDFFLKYIRGEKIDGVWNNDELLSS